MGLFMENIFRQLAIHHLSIPMTGIRGNEDVIQKLTDAFHL